MKKYYKASEDIKLPFQEPTDKFMCEIVCAILKNVREEANTIKYSNSYANGGKKEKKRLEGIIEFAKSNDYWWNVLDTFCPDVDNKKVRRGLVKVASKSLLKLKELRS